MRFCFVSKNSIDGRYGIYYFIVVNIIIIIIYKQNYCIVCDLYHCSAKLVWENSSAILYHSQATLNIKLI